MTNESEERAAELQEIEDKVVHIEQTLLTRAIEPTEVADLQAQTSALKYSDVENFTLGVLELDRTNLSGRLHSLGEQCLDDEAARNELKSRMPPIGE